MFPVLTYIWSLVLYWIVFLKHRNLFDFFKYIITFITIVMQEMIAIDDL